MFDRVQAIKSRQALDEIVGIYSSGMGDQEVLLLDIDKEELCKLTDKNLNLHSNQQTQKGVSTTIEEGDEDEAEREELKEVAAIAENILQKKKLEAEWDSLEDSEECSPDNFQEGYNTKTVDDLIETEFTETKYSEALEYLRYVRTFVLLI